jgi:hypothetical protein
MRARDNPFRTERVLSVRYRLADGTFDGLLDRFEAMGRRAAIVGPKGHGKTTLLEDLAPRLRDRGFTVRDLRLDEEHPRFDRAFLGEFLRSLGPRDVILFDGAEQLGRFSWFRFERATRPAGGLLITTHRAGRLPTLIETTTTPALLNGLVDEILGSRASDVRSLTPELFEKHRGNLRDALRELYDRYAAVSGPA